MLCHQHILWIIYVIRKDRFFILSSLFYTGWALLGRGLTTHTFQSLNCVQFMWWCNKHNMYYSKFYTRLIYYVTAFLDFFTFHSVFTPPEMKKCIKYSLFLFFLFKVSISHGVYFLFFAEKMMIKAKNVSCAIPKNRWFNKTQKFLCNHFVLDIFSSLADSLIFCRNAIRFYGRSGCVTWSAIGEPHLFTIFLANYITTSIYILGIKMIIQFFMNENVYIRILCHSQNIFSLSRCFFYYLRCVFTLFLFLFSKIYKFIKNFTEF